DTAKAARSAGLRPDRRASWRKSLRKCKGGKGDRIEKRMHCHRDKDGTAPFVCNGEATSQNEQGDKRREVRVRCREQRRAERDTNKAAKIAFDDVVEEKSK